MLLTLHASAEYKRHMEHGSWGIREYTYRNGSRWVGGYFPGLWTSRQRIHYKALPTAGGCLPFLFCAPQGPHLVAHLPNMGVVDEIFMTSGLCMFGDSSMRLEPNRMFGSKSVDYARHKFKGGLSKWDHPSGPAQLSSRSQHSLQIWDEWSASIYDTLRSCLFLRWCGNGTSPPVRDSPKENVCLLPTGLWAVSCSRDRSLSLM